MNERINIIKAGCVTIQYGNGFKDEIKASVRSFRISRSESDTVTIHLDGEILFRTKIYLVTIQDGRTGTPEQLTPANWDELTDIIFSH